MSQAIEQQILKLKQAQDWDALASLYENLIQHTQQKEEKLFFMWELAELLSSELGEAGGALIILNEALQLGAPISVILPKLEFLRKNFLLDIQAIDLYEKNLNALLNIGLNDQNQQDVYLIALALYEAYLSQNRNDEAEFIRQQLSLPVQPKSAQVSNQKNQPSLANQDYQDFLASEKAYQSSSVSQDLLKTPMQIEHGFKEVIQAQDTGIAEKNLQLQQILQRLQQHGPHPRNADAFLNDFEYLCSLTPLNRDLQLHLEAPLWQAAQLSNGNSTWRRWAKIYEAAYASQSESIEMMVQRNLRLGAVYEEKLEELGQAIKKYELILSYVPSHHEAFLRLKGIYQKQHLWDSMIQLMKQYVQNLPDRNLSFELYLELGDIYRDQVKSHSKAVATWFQALEIMPENRQILVRLLEVYQQTEKWPAAVKVLKKLIKLEVLPTKKAHYVYAIGLIQRDHLSDHYMAVRTFDEALECDPSFLKAFYALSEILIQDQDFARQDRYFRKMLIRAIEHQQDSAIIAEIAKQLAVLNLEKLNDLQSARQAYELVLNYRPDDQDALQKLVQLKKHIDGPRAAAEQAYQTVRRNPTHIQSYQQLYELAIEADDLDWAWCVAAVLQEQKQHYLDSAQFLIEGQKRISSRLQQALSLQDWRLLIWSGKKEAFDQLCALCNAVCLDLFAQKPKRFQIHLKKDRMQLAQAGTFGRVVDYLSQMMGISPPPIWIGQPKTGLNLEVVAFDEVGIVVSQAFSQSKNIEEVACQLAYALYLSQAQFWLSAILADQGSAWERVELLTQSAVQGLLTGVQNPKGDVAEIAQQLLKMPADIKNDMKMVVQNLQLEGDDVLKWLKAVEQSAYRVALLMCGSLGHVVDLMRQQPAISGESLEERVVKLYLFAISQPYLEIRQRLGLALKLS